MNNISGYKLVQLKGKSLKGIKHIKEYGNVAWIKFENDKYWLIENTVGYWRWMSKENDRDFIIVL